MPSLRGLCSRPLCEQVQSPRKLCGSGCDGWRQVGLPTTVSFGISSDYHLRKARQSRASHPSQVQTACNGEAWLTTGHNCWGRHSRRKFILFPNSFSGQREAGNAVTQEAWGAHWYSQLRSDVSVLTLAQLASAKVGKKVEAGKSWPGTQARDQDLYFWLAKELE